MKIGVAQINLKIGSLESNASQIIAAAHKLAEQGVKLAIFPELAISGYYPWDILDQPGFVEEQNEQLERIAHETKNLDITIALGHVSIAQNAGKPFHNSFSLIKNGQMIETAHKQLLPTYNIFDERRHFEPGNRSSVVEIEGEKIGFLICEDAWNDDGLSYENNPIESAIAQKATTIITLNASPWQTNKHLNRIKLFSKTCKSRGISMLYVNQVGAHDEIVYDGASFAIDSSGQVTWQGEFAKQDICALDFDGMSYQGKTTAAWPTEEPAQQLAMIELGLVDYMNKCGFKKVVVGSSGGIDSAVTIAIAARALGSENVTAVTMPSKYSTSGSVDDSVELCDRLNVTLNTLPIKKGFDTQMEAFLDAFGHNPSRLAIENTQARLRGLALMTFSNDTGAMLLTTGNKSEVSVGYCTLYGDMNGGLNLIGDLYKTEVYNLARHINAVDARAPIPAQIIDKAPSAELFDDQKDSDSLPPYDELDAILRLYIERDLLSEDEIKTAWETLTRFETTDQLMEKIMRMVDKAEFKRWQSCPILRVHARAFGTGRRYPIAQGFTPSAKLLRKVKPRAQEAKS